MRAPANSPLRPPNRWCLNIAIFYRNSRSPHPPTTAQWPKHHRCASGPNIGADEVPGAHHHGWSERKPPNGSRYHGRSEADDPAPELYSRCAPRSLLQKILILRHRAVCSVAIARRARSRGTSAWMERTEAAERKPPSRPFGSRRPGARIVLAPRAEIVIAENLDISPRCCLFCCRCTSVTII